MLEIYGGIKRTEEQENNNVAERPTESPVTVTPIKDYQRVFFGRRVLTHSIKKSELTAEKIRQILPQVLREHQKNANEIDYLYNYYKGKQPILKKQKNVRPEINNKVLENHAFEIVEFKKAYVYGEPVQYVQKGEKDNQIINPEISDLNRFMESEDKSSRDKELAEWQYICGTAYRWTDVDKDEEDEDDAPFEIRIPDPRRTFVVYSSGIKGEQLFSGHYSYFSESIQTENGEEFISKYRIVTVYTEKFQCEFKESFGNFEILNLEMPINDTETQLVKEYQLTIKGHRIIEYPLNNARLGLIELVMTGLNALNRIKSDDLDGIDQFIQSLLVFVNQDVDAEDVVELMALGAVKINSNDPNKPADIKLLTSQLMHSETKIVTDDIYNNVLTICGVPRLNDKPSGGDTGQARLLGEGWTMADERAKQDELSFKKSERQFLKLILEICKYKNTLKNLKISDIDIKFTRNKSDNLLVKTQGLMNMQTSQVPPEIAFVTCGLFSDPNDVYQKAREYYGDELWKQNSNQKENTLVDEGITDRTNTSTHSETNGEGVEKGNENGRGISKNIV